MNWLLDLSAFLGELIQKAQGNWALVVSQVNGRVESIEWNDCGGTQL